MNLEEKLQNAFVEVFPDPSTTTNIDLLFSIITKFRKKEANKFLEIYKKVYGKYSNYVGYMNSKMPIQNADASEPGVNDTFSIIYYKNAHRYVSDKDSNNIMIKTTMDILKIYLVQVDENKYTFDMDSMISDGLVESLASTLDKNLQDIFMNIYQVIRLLVSVYRNITLGDDLIQDIERFRVCFLNTFPKLSTNAIEMYKKIFYDTNHDVRAVFDVLKLVYNDMYKNMDNINNAIEYIVKKYEESEKPVQYIQGRKSEIERYRRYKWCALAYVMDQMDRAIKLDQEGKCMGFDTHMLTHMGTNIILFPMKGNTAGEQISFLASSLFIFLDQLASLKHQMDYQQLQQQDPDTYGPNQPTPMDPSKGGGRGGLFKRLFGFGAFMQRKKKQKVQSQTQAQTQLAEPDNDLQAARNLLATRLMSGDTQQQQMVPYDPNPVDPTVGQMVPFTPQAQQQQVQLPNILPDEPVRKRPYQPYALHQTGYPMQQATWFSPSHPRHQRNQRNQRRPQMVPRPQMIPRDIGFDIDITLVRKRKRKRKRNGPGQGPGRGIQCPYCQQTLKNALWYKRHLRDSHEDQMYGCPNCSQFFISKEELETHNFDRHRNNPLYYCTIPGCSQVFAIKQQLQYHIEKHQGWHRRDDTSFGKM